MLTKVLPGNDPRPSRARRVLRHAAVVLAGLVTVALAIAGASLGSIAAHASGGGATGLTLIVLSDDTSALVNDNSTTNGIVPAGGGGVQYQWGWADPVAPNQTFSQTLPAGMVWTPASIAGPGCSVSGTITSGETLTCVLSGLTLGAGGTITQAATVYSMANNATINTTLVSGSNTSATSTLTVRATLDVAMYPGYIAAPNTHVLDPKTNSIGGDQFTWFFGLYVPRAEGDSKGAESLNGVPIVVSMTKPSDAEDVSCDSGARIQGVGGNSVATTNTQYVPNGGSITCSSTGSTVTMTITGTDSTFQRFPTGGLYTAPLGPSANGYFFVGEYKFWMPGTDFPTSSSSLSFSQSAFSVTGLDGTTEQIGAWSSGTVTPGAYPAQPFSGGAMNNSYYNGLTAPIAPGSESDLGVWAQAPDPGQSTGASICEVWDNSLWTLTGPPKSWTLAHSGPTIPSSDYTVEYGTNYYANDAARSQPCGFVGDDSSGKWYSYSALLAGPGLTAVTAVRIEYNKPWTWISGSQFPDVPLVVAQNAADVPYEHLNVFGSAWDDQVNWNTESESAWASTYTSTYYGTYSPASVGIANTSTTFASSVSRGLSINGTIDVAESGTAVDPATVTAVLPNACFTFESVVGSAPTSVSTYNQPAQGQSCTALAGQTVTWTLPAFQHSSTTTVPISFTMYTDPGTPVPTTYTLSTSVTSPDDAHGTQSYSPTVVVASNPAQILATTTTPSSSVLHGATLAYRLTWQNLTGAAMTTQSGYSEAAHVVDVLPWNGDGRGTQGLTGLTLGTVTTTPSGLTVEYSTDSVSSLSTNLAIDPSGNAGINWVLSKPASGVTAIRIDVPTLADTNSESAVVPVVPTFATTSQSTPPVTDALGDNMTFTPDAAITKSTSSTVAVTPSATTTVSGVAYTDVDYSGTQNSGDTPISGATVTITGHTFGIDGVDGTGDDVTITPMTTTTGGNGAYSFIVDPGSYTVSVSGLTGLTAASLPPSPFVVQAATPSVESFLYQATLPRPVVSSSSVNVSQGSSAGVSVDTTSGAPAVPGHASTIAVTTAPSRGTTSISGSTITYSASPTWPAGVTGTTYTDTFGYTLTNLQGTVSPSATVTVTVYRTPSAVPDTATVPSTTPTTLSVLGNDIGDNLTLTTVTLPSGITNNAQVGKDPFLTNEVLFTPPTNYVWANGQTSYTQVVNYTAKDSQGQIVSSTLTLTVLRAPVAGNTAVTVSANGTSATVNVLAQATVTQPTVALGAVPSGVHATVDGSNDIVVYATGPSASPVSVPYTITDTVGQQVSESLVVTVLPVPTASDIGAPGSPIPVRGNHSTALALAGHVSGTGATVSVPSATSIGGAAVTVAPGGATLNYVPQNGFTGADSFNYTVTDQLGVTQTATAYLYVDPVPTATDLGSSLNPLVLKGGAVNTLSLTGHISGSNLVVSTPGSSSLGVALSATTSAIRYDATSVTPVSATAEQFTYTVTDDAGATASATVWVRLDPVPTATDVGSAQHPVVLKGGAVDSLSLSGHVSGSNAVVSVEVVSGLGATLSATPSVIGYDATLVRPASATMEHFIYTVTDDAGATATATVWVQLDPVPTAADVGSVGSPMPVQGSVPNAIDLASRISGDALTVTVAGSTAHATLTVSGTTVTYTPATGYTGADSFGYSVTDGAGATASGTVYVAVDAVPSAADVGPLSVPGGGSKVVDLSTSIAGSGLSVSLPSARSAQNGRLTLSGSSVTYEVPSAGFTGSDHFTYTITDSAGATRSAIVQLIVDPVPTAVNVGPVLVSGGGSKAIDLSGDISGTGLTVSLPSTSLPSGAAVSVSGTTVTYDAHAITPVLPQTDQFDYVVTDAAGVTKTATISVTVDPVPTAIGFGTALSPVTVAGNGTKSFIVDSAHQSGADTTISVPTQPAHGSVFVLGTVITYLPTAGWSGADQFSFEVTDDSGAYATASVYVFVDPVPTATGFGSAGVPILVSGDGSKSFTVDSAHQSGANTVLSVAQPVHGSAVIVGNVIDYTPSVGFAGSDPFTFTVTDDAGATATATIYPRVLVVPAPVDDSARTPSNTPVTIDVLGNDTGDASLSIAGFTQPATGTVTTTSDPASLLFTPDSSTQGNTVTFTYWVSDASGASTAAQPTTVTVTVTSALSLGTVTNATVPWTSSTTLDVLSGATGDAVTLVGPLSASSGTVTVHGGDLVYTPDGQHVWASTDSHYTATVDYWLQDSWGTRLPGSVAITIIRPPTTTSHTAGIYSGSVSTAAVLATDSVYSGTGTVTITQSPAAALGSATVSNNVLSFASTAGQTGQAVILYTVTDALGQSTPGSFDVTVAAPLRVVDQGVPTPLVSSTGGRTIDALSGDSGSGLTLVAVTQPAHGSVAITGAILSFSSDGTTGAEQFEYTVQDILGNTAMAHVYLTVTLAPVAIDDTATTDVSRPITIDVLANDSIASAPAAVESVSQPSSGTVDITGTTVRFTPATTGIFTFTYLVQDAAGFTSAQPGTVTVTVTSSIVPSLSIVMNSDHRSFTVTGQALQSGAEWSVVLHSVPTTIATGTVGAGGSVRELIGLSSNVTPGYHTLVATGLGANGASVSFSLHFYVNADGTLAFTGADAAPWLLAGAALLGGGMLLLALVAWLRRRRNNAATSAV